MDDPQGIIVSGSTPLRLSEQQKWLCRHLDLLNSTQGFCRGIDPSVLFEGALGIMKSETRISAKDWMAQAAHSLREITYDLGKVRSPSHFQKVVILIRTVFGYSRDDLKKTRKERLQDLIILYQEEAKAADIADTLNQLNYIFTNVAHHFKDRGEHNRLRAKIEKLLSRRLVNFPPLETTEFEELVQILEGAWAQSIPEQLPMHKRIDAILGRNPTNSDKDKLQIVLGFNPDARNYFFFQAPVGWATWLWENGFLEAIKQPVDNATQFSYRSPELNYLARVAEKVPGEVVDIMLRVGDLDQFNPEVLSRFLDICAKLPADQLERIIPVIHDKHWLERIAPFDRWGFGCKEMLETLSKVKDTDSILVLAESMLAVRPKSELDKAGPYTTESPFYLKNLNETSVFECLARLDEESAEAVFSLATKVLGNIIALGGGGDDAKPFVAKDEYEFYDVDFFDLSSRTTHHGSYREDLNELVMLVTESAQKTIGSKCNKPEQVLRLFRDNVEPLPDTLVTWRLRLFVWSLCPAVFQQQLRDALFRVFEGEDLYAVTLGTEYKKTLKKVFGQLSPDDQITYIDKIFEIFGPDEEHLHTALQLLSSLPGEFITDAIKERSKSEFGSEPDSKFEPQPMMGRVTSGLVIAQSPPDAEATWREPIPYIVQKLKTDWKPDQVIKLDKESDFHKPINGEGVGAELQVQIKHRIPEYLSSATLFFDRSALDPHYTYSYLRGIYDLLNDKSLSSDVDWLPLFQLFAAIQSSAEQQMFSAGEFERELRHGWLATWDSVHSALADVIGLLLGRNAGEAIIPFTTYRDQLLSFIAYLLKHQNPAPKAIGTDEESQRRRDLHTAAINSVRGQAYDALMLFLYADGKKFKKTDAVKIDPDVKKIINELVGKEKAAPILFLVGRNLATLYYRDKDWAINDIVPRVLNHEESDRFLAAWAGYLSNNLFLDLFEKLKEQYQFAITLSSEKYPGREAERDIDNALATHLALAFIYGSGFTLESDLFTSFWATQNSHRHAEFIEFIGRHVFLRENQDEWTKENKINIDKLREFWNWALENSTIETEALRAFGGWVKADSSLLEPTWLAERIERTLIRTGGEFEWDHGLIESLPAITEIAPERAVKILRSLLLDSSLVSQRGGFFMAGYNTNIVDIFRMLYQNLKTQADTKKLINDLIAKHGSPFWPLKDVLIKD